MTTTTAPRALLAPPTGRAELDRLALARDWALVQILAQREGRPRQVTWATPDGEALVTLVEDHRIDARYLVVSAHVPDPTLEAIRAALPCLGPAEVLGLLEDPAERIRALCWLGIVGPSAPEGPAALALRDALADDDPTARDAARFAVQALGWPDSEVAT